MCDEVCSISTQLIWASRHSQGLRFRLQLEKTKHCGWGVLSWDTIPVGAFVGIYYGQVGL